MPPPFDVITGRVPGYGITRPYLVIEIITLTFREPALRIAVFPAGTEGEV
jgi:hypothetical protein